MRPKIVFDIPKNYKHECQKCGKCCSSKKKHDYFNRIWQEQYRLKAEFTKEYTGTPTNLPLISYPEAMTLRKAGYDICTPIMVLYDKRTTIIHYAPKQVDNKCICLREDNICKLHGLGLKPLYCQIYPFGLTYDPRKMVLRVYLVDVMCEGVGKGRPIVKIQMKRMIERFVSFTQYAIPTGQAVEELKRFNIKPLGLIQRRDETVQGTD